MFEIFLKIIIIINNNNDSLPHISPTDTMSLYSMINHWSESMLPGRPAVRDPVSQHCLADQLWGIELGLANSLRQRWLSGSLTTGPQGNIDSLDPSRLVCEVTLTQFSGLSCSMDRRPVVRGTDKPPHDRDKSLYPPSLYCKLGFQMPICTGTDFWSFGKIVAAAV